ncbi:conserved hypothetical protein [Leishmania braziliensis MHOM/BR/75/M2904]|uniref:Nodulin-like domain-containing protein n=2 Tax=Leishmania braziliensis TaxID=5660 RepID=A4HJ50_LEIBR|nr:conserved hypothetical protein [Leishmania braziliensis MHOM/BR/75/M2904]CAJ2477756.1 unnamed protein product [Leishmania braziliensis]CAM42509.1 conserved hypothetical protein [Leishmania braziliensis MHOM/BR/75/M2904]SYZ68270.1 hypothetical_protein [Leishmania braziliensis MHOM/BR/75/M2904]
MLHSVTIDNLRRFRILFAGVILSISSSTQGVHSVFGVLHLQQAYQFNARSMTIVYLSGVSVGLFTLPFGALYDWFGPRVVVALGSVIAALGHLLFALTFGGHIPPTVLNCAVFYAMMCWGCYALNVAVLPAVLTHMPRDRGQPTGLLQTFTGLGASVFACLFRGFFKDNFAHLMWFMFAVTLAAGAGGVTEREELCTPFPSSPLESLSMTHCTALGTVAPSCLFCFLLTPSFPFSRILTSPALPLCFRWHFLALAYSKL